MNNFRIHDNISFKPHSDAKTEMAEKQPKLGCRVMKSMDNQEGSTTDRIGDVSFYLYVRNPFVCERGMLKSRDEEVSSMHFPGPSKHLLLLSRLSEEGMERPQKVP